jgi:lysozyme family protein
MNANFAACLAFVWRSGFDSPADGYHVTPGDPGGGTKGGVTHATWAQAAAAGIVKGSLADATEEQLSAVLRTLYWGKACDVLPIGVDLLLFNGQMMSGHFPCLLQQCCGFVGSESVDGWIGPLSLARIASREPETLIDAVTGVHAAYLSTLEAFPRFAGGWLKRLRACQTTAIEMVNAAPVA